MGFVGPAMIAWIKDKTGSFGGGLYFVAGLLVLSAVLTLVLSRFRAPEVMPTKAVVHRTAAGSLPGWFFNPVPACRDAHHDAECLHI